MKNLLKSIPKDISKELFETLAKNKHIHIERIISKGHTAPKKGWYNQEKNELVLLLKGAARLEFEDGSEVSMAPGDCMEILAGVKHRVAWTEPEEETVWVAIHYPP